MVESVYQILEKIGYTHPLHPTMTHLVMGLVMAVFIFGLIAIWFKRSSLAKTARHCVVLALIALPPTALLGYADWQYRLAGAWVFPIIMKLILASGLLVLLVVAIVVGLRKEESLRKLVTIYTLSLVAVIGIGYFGGELVYGKKAQAGKIERGLVSKGAVVFNQNCSACHYSDKTETKIGPGLKGIFKMENMPSSGRPVTEANVRSQVKTPYGNMPAFPELAEEKVDVLIAFLKTL